MSDYPEHDKLAALRTDPNDPFSGKNQTVGDFIEWLRSSGRDIARWHRICPGGPGDNEMWEDCGAFLPDEPADEKVLCPACGRRPRGSIRMLPTHDTTTGLVGEFFGIDSKKLSIEKDRMLREIRGECPDCGFKAGHDRRCPRYDHYVAEMEAEERHDDAILK